jgi:hypothetical protein
MTQTSIDDAHKEELQELERVHGDRFRLFKKCPGQSYFSRCKMSDNSIQSYTSLIQSVRFCLIVKNQAPDQSAEVALFDAMRFNCLPVFLSAEDWVLPFSEIVDWSLISLTTHSVFMKKDLFLNFFDDRSNEELNSMFHQLELVYKTYFSSIQAITSTMLDILSYRVYSAFKRSNEFYNFKAEQKSNDPFLIPYKPNINLGFTLMIVSHDEAYFRYTLEMLKSGILFEKMRNLTKIILLWYGSPEKLTDYNTKELARNVNVTFLVMQTNGVFRSRYSVFDEMETEAVSVLDDCFLPHVNLHDLSELYTTWLALPTRLLFMKPFGSIDKQFSPVLYTAYLNKHFRLANSKHSSSHLSEKNFFCESSKFWHHFANLTMRLESVSECSDSETIKCAYTKAKLEKFSRDCENYL